MRKHFIILLALVSASLFVTTAYAQVRSSIPDSPDGIFIFRQEFGTTQADDDHPVLKTVRIGPSIVVTLYDPASKVGSMAHIAIRENGWLGKMVLSMQRAGYDNQDKSAVEARIVGGVDGMSDDLYEAINNLLSSFGFTNMVEVDYGNFKAENVALDTRNGKLYDLRDIIPWTAPETETEDEQLRREIRVLRAQMPPVHYTGDDRAKQYQVR